MPDGFSDWLDDGRLGRWHRSLALIFIGIAWLGTLMARPVMRHLAHRRRPSNEMVSHIVSIFGLIHVVVLVLMTAALWKTQHRLNQVEAHRATLAARVSEAEADAGQYKTSLEQAAKRLQELNADRDSALSEIDRLQRQIGKLEQNRLRNEISWPRAAAAELRLVTVATSEVDPQESDAFPPETVRPETVITDAPPGTRARRYRICSPAHQRVRAHTRINGAQHRTLVLAVRS